MTHKPSQNYTKTQLIEAIKSKNIQKVKQVLQDGIDPNDTLYDPISRKEFTLLMYALLTSGNDSYPIMKMILEAGADPNHGKYKPLDVATKTGSTGMVKLLVEHGAKLRRKHLSPGSTENAKTILTTHANKFTPATLKKFLFDIIKYENLELLLFLVRSTTKLKLQDVDLLFDCALRNKPTVIEQLAAHGVDVDQRWNGWTTLMYAASLGNASVAKALLKAGADPHLQNHHGVTAWMIAHAHGNSETAQVLLDGGATAVDQVPTEIQAINPAHGRYEAEVRDDIATLSPLMQAACYGRTEEVKRLLATGEHTMDRKELGALHFTVESGYTETIKALLFEPDLLDDHTRNFLRHPTRLISNQDIIDALLINLPEPDKDEFQEEIFQSAVGLNNAPLVASMLKNGMTQACSFDESANPPLYVAARFGHPDTVRVLLANLDDRSVQDRSDAIRIALKQTVRMRNPECFDLIMNSKPDQKSLDQALHTAVSVENLEALKALVEAGANPHFINDEGLTVLQLTEQRGNTELLKLLQPTTP